MSVMKFIFVCMTVLILLASAGCGIIAGKDVATEVDPNFNPSDYKWFRMSGNPAYCSILDCFLRDEQKMKYPSKKTKKGIIAISVVDEQGCCLPPCRYGHFELTCQSPRKVDITITDAVSKSVLLTIRYRRALFTWNGTSRDCEQAIDAALHESFAQASNNHRSKTPAQTGAPQTATPVKP